jgi:hypothetical protein
VLRSLISPKVIDFILGSLFGNMRVTFSPIDPQEKEVKLMSSPGNMIVAPGNISLQEKEVRLLKFSGNVRVTPRKQDPISPQEKEVKLLSSFGSVNDLSIRSQAKEVNFGSSSKNAMGSPSKDAMGSGPSHTIFPQEKEVRLLTPLVSVRGLYQFNPIVKLLRLLNKTEKSPDRFFLFQPVTEVRLLNEFGNVRVTFSPILPQVKDINFGSSSGNVRVVPLKILLKEK